MDSCIDDTNWSQTTKERVKFWGVGGTRFVTNALVGLGVSSKLTQLAAEGAKQTARTTVAKTASSVISNTSEQAGKKISSDALTKVSEEIAEKMLLKSAETGVKIAQETTSQIITESFKKVGVEVSKEVIETTAMELTKQAVLPLAVKEGASQFISVAGRKICAKVASTGAVVVYTGAVKLITENNGNSEQNHSLPNRHPLNYAHEEEKIDRASIQINHIDH